MFIEFNNKLVNLNKAFCFELSYNLEDVSCKITLFLDKRRKDWLEEIFNVTQYIDFDKAEFAAVTRYLELTEILTKK